jgi:hypothetical protein
MARLVWVKSVTVVIRVNARFVRETHRCRRIIRWRVFNLLSRQVNSDLGIGPDYILNPRRRGKYLVAQPPVTRIHDEIANGPRSSHR